MPAARIFPQARVRWVRRHRRALPIRWWKFRAQMRCWVANPADKTIYYYKEGMAAPMGNFSNYDREPRAALVVDRSLRERWAGSLRNHSAIDTLAADRRRVAFLLDAPRFIDCFDLPAIEGDAVSENHPVRIEPMAASRSVQVGRQRSSAIPAERLGDPRDEERC